MGYTPHVLIVGGGVTGTGVARDLAMRGLEVTLVEKGTLTDGTTGRMHGLLHSGARYADTNPALAEQCVRENRVLRDIGAHCVEETGGLFVSLAGDDSDYFERKQAACEEVDIPVERLDAASAREYEPALAEDVEAALAVPDAAVDPFRLTVANAKSALEYGATIRTHTRVIDVLRMEETVSGVRVREDAPGDRGHSAADVQEIEADYVVNATGPWADTVAEKARLDVPLTRSKGAMVVQRFPALDTVVNRCRPKDDGDIVVPHGEMAILGTTDEPVDDPERFPEEDREVDFLLDELATLVPGVADARTFRTYWGVRPLFDPEGADAGPGTGEGGTRDVSRDYLIVDHEERDGVWGISTVVGGKFTTYRHVAEAVADHVCAKFGIDRPCRTADVPLPGSEDETVIEDAMERFGLASPVAHRSADRLGSRAADVLDTGDDPNPVVCDCEAVTRAEIRDAIDDETGEAPDLNEVRIRTRASMGTCQGGRCAHRLAAGLYPTFDEITVRRALDDLLEERWRGQRHTLWGEQLSQAMRNYALHATTMNRDSGILDQVAPIEWARFDPGKDWVERQEQAEDEESEDRDEDGVVEGRDEDGVVEGRDTADRPDADETQGTDPSAENFQPFSGLEDHDEEGPVGAEQAPDGQGQDETATDDTPPGGDADEAGGRPP